MEWLHLVLVGQLCGGIPAYPYVGIASGHGDDDIPQFM